MDLGSVCLQCAQRDSDNDVAIPDLVQYPALRVIPNKGINKLIKLTYFGFTSGISLVGPYHTLGVGCVLSRATHCHTLVTLAFSFIAGGLGICLPSTRPVGQ